tara:strand:+ start:194 stop:508 length:315 start_codon:yes stop_codon:yes gene_type:complete
MAEKVDTKMEDIAVNEEKKLTSDELKEVQQYDQKFQQIQFAFGEIQIMKMNLEKREVSLKEQFDKTVEDQNEMRKSLQEKYGEVSVDKNTGVITETPPAPQQEG